MSHETTLLYTEPLVRQAVFAYWSRSVGIGFAFALLMVALGLAALVAHGDTSWVVGVLASALFVGVALAATLYFVHYRETLRKFRAMGNPQAMFRVDESSFTISSSFGSATLPWSVVKELWKTPNSWLLLYSSAQFNTLPLVCLSPEMQTYILQRVKAAGGKIRG